MIAIRNESQRISLSFAMAVGLHVFVLVGIGFAVDFKPLTHPLETLDVVLVNWRSETPPDEADFLAQADQQGGGDAKEVDRPSQENTGAAPGPADGEDAMDQQQKHASAADAARRQILVEDRNAAELQQITALAQPESLMPSVAELRQDSMQMARLQPGLQRDGKMQSRGKNKKYISANTSAYEYAAYMQAWVAKVERVGNINYPDELRRNKLIGNVILTVGIQRDGSVEEILVKRSSGEPLIDQAAVRIVRLASPYSPLTNQMDENLDVLYITRTWEFSRGFQGLN